MFITDLTGTHFMGGYPMNSQAYVSDSSTGGSGKFTDVVPRNNDIKDSMKKLLFILLLFIAVLN